MQRRLERIWHHSQSVVLPAIAIVLLGLLWEGAVHFFEIPVYLLPAPSVIWTGFIVHVDLVLGHTMATVGTILSGFALSIAISFPLAVMIASSPLLANTTYPLLVLTQSVPKVALAPILVVVLGAGEMPRVIVTFLVAFFPLVTSLASGLLAVPTDLIELSRSYRAKWWQEMWLIRLPWSVPFLFNGLKLSITFAVVGATVGEFVAADKGLGYQIMAATSFFNTPVAFGALIILSLLGIVLFQAVVILERVLFPWSLPRSEELA